MADQVCERCGGTATVTVAAVRSNRGGERQPATEHRYCRACARMVGVPVPERTEGPAVITEPEPPTWSDIEHHLAQYEHILREQPALRDHVSSMARQLLRLSKLLPGPMPSAVAGAFTRIGVSESKRD